MKSLFSFMFVFMLIGSATAESQFSSLAGAINKKASGRQIMKRVQDRDTGKDSQSLMTMDLMVRGRAETREFVLFRKEQGPESKVLIKFKGPNTMKNTGLLLHSNKKSDDQMWLYLSRAAKKEPRKISTNNKGNSFVGSDFYFTDFEDRPLDSYKHKFLGKKKLGKKSLLVVESVAKSKDEVYSKIISWVDPTSYVALKVEMFKGKKKIKEFRVKDLAKVNGIWTIQASEMADLVRKKKTSLKLQKVKYNSGVSQELFSFEKLTAEM